MDGLKEDIPLSSQVFDEMYNLRFLLFLKSGLGSSKVHLPNGLNCLPDELRILYWSEYPLRALPSNFDTKNLVQIDLFRSNIEQLWKGTKDAPKLKWLNLSYCEHLTKIPNLSDFPLLVEVDLSCCKSLVDFPSSVQQHNNLRNLYLSETAIEEVPSSIQSLTKLSWLDLSECRRLKHISTSICKLKSLPTLDLTDCSQLENFPEILETMESLKYLDLSRSAIKVLPPSIEHLIGLQSLNLDRCKNLEMLPSSICNLTSLYDLDLSYCSKLEKLPDNLGNLKSLKKLKVLGTAVGQLPSSITCLENLEDLACSGCRGLTRLPPLSGLHSLIRLYSNNCSLMEIPEDIGCLSSLQSLDLSGNMFESLPRSIKQLSKLEVLSLIDCKMLRSIPVIPAGLQYLKATDCDRLCQVPDASEFVRCIYSNSKRFGHVDFIFTNSLNLISNVFEESLRIMQHKKKECGIPSKQFTIFLPGNKIPEWFSYQSPESSVNIRVLRNDLVNRKAMGFALCAVLGSGEYYTRFSDSIYCVFEISCDHIKISNGSPFMPVDHSGFMHSEHMVLGYDPFSNIFPQFENPNKLPISDGGCLDISIEFKSKYGGNRPKRCAVHLLYEEEPIQIIGATIQEIGETSGRRSDRSDDNDEEVEPHPKRICTQEIKTLDLFH